ncbi:hypothetical protein [Caenispirillum bisanense]|uniref:Uncharacterized protein n=1 Tax=Caenispirillum bisanense TaxID=414052 RepID=A0A286GDE5_9PROT|nr:hypothetical protein [Caenispirillum bisanense]SOD93266.1 hypothetical protein SAMN05421508_1039 [Caenispirillum bisanense]
MTGIRFVLGVLDGTWMVDVFTGDDHLFQEVAATEEQALAAARRRLEGRAPEPVPAPRPVPPPPPRQLPAGATASRGIQIQDRAALLPVPEVFYLEEGVDRRRWDAENSVDSPSRGHHQVDPRRPVSCTPIMPDVRRAATEGNAYPPSYAAAPDLVRSTPAYRDLVEVSHAVYRLLADERTLTIGAAKAAMEAAMGRRFSPRIRDACVADTLRDLRLYGLAQADRAGRFTARTCFTWVDPATVALVDPADPGR